MDASTENTLGNIGNVIKNDSFTVNNLVEWLEGTGLTSLGMPYVCMYEPLQGNRDYLELDFFLPYQAKSTQVQIWRGSVADENHITRNYPYGVFAWTAPLHEFTTRFGQQRLVPGVLSETDNLLSLTKATFDGLSPEETASVVYVALILKEDLFVDENNFGYKKNQNIIDNIVHTCEIWDVTPKDILRIGIERFAYLCRISPDSLDEKDILMEAPITWLDTVFSPILKYSYKQITAPSAILHDRGRRKIIRL